LINSLCFGQYLFNNISKEGGLETSQINVIEKDLYGFIWMGTERGLFRFDGTDILSFRHNPNDSTTISEDIIRSLFIDSKGNIWAGTRDKGVNIIDPVTLNIRHIYPSENNKPGLTSGQNNAIYESEDGNVWITSSFFGFDIFNKKENTFTNYKPTDQYDKLQSRLINTVVCCTPDPKNTEFIWFGTLQGIFKFNTNTKQWLYFPITIANAENPELFGGREEIVRDLLFVSDTELWFCSWGGGICKLNTLSGNYTIFKYEEPEPVNGYRNNVKKLVRKSKTELWFAAEHEGLGVINIKTGEIFFLSESPESEVLVKSPSDILFDEDGYLFFRRRKEETIRFRGHFVSTTEVEAILDNHPNVLESAVFAVPDEFGQEQDVMAAVKLKSGDRISPTKLLRHCEADLPFYMIPCYVRFVKEFEKTPTLRIIKDRLQKEGVTSDTWNRRKADFKLARD